jgi:hypothetical protein
MNRSQQFCWHSYRLAEAVVGTCAGKRRHMRGRGGSGDKEIRSTRLAIEQ